MMSTSTLGSHLDIVHEDGARLCSCELICELQCLHDMSIVHFDLKHGEILLSHLCYVLITDFDWSCDMSERGRPPEMRNIYKTFHCMGPKIVNGIEITTKADV